MPEATQSADVLRAVQERSRFFEGRFAAGDARGLVEGYFVAEAEKPVASPPGGPPVRGHAALIEMFAGQIREVSGIRLETLELDTSGTLAFEFGRAHLQLRSGAEVKGRYAVQWRKGSDGWRVKTDFFAEGWV